VTPAVVRRLGTLTETVHAVVASAPEAQAANAPRWGYSVSRACASGSVRPELLRGSATAMVARPVPDVRVERRAHDEVRHDALVLAAGHPVAEVRHDAMWRLLTHEQDADV
jgi:hypothetical protein